MARRTEGDGEVLWEPAWRLAELVRSGEVTATTVVKAHLARIDRVDPDVHAFITVCRDEALAGAAAVDDAVAAGDDPGPLAGVPVALKDELWTAGVRSTGGSLVYADHVPAEGSPVVDRLNEAGAVVVGKTQMPEFAMWPRSVNRVAEEARNPWDTKRIPGASSGGSAAAVAAGMVPVAVGSDGGGSTRIPSALCGVVGFHPTSGRVPSRCTFSYSPFASLGAIARDVRDVALLLGAMAGPDPLDPTSLAEAPPDLLTALDQGVAGLRVAWTPDQGWIEADPRVVAPAHALAGRLRDAGAVVEDPGLAIGDVWPWFPTATIGASDHGGAPVPFVASAQNRQRCLARPDLLAPGVAELLTAPRPTADEFATAMAGAELVLDHVRGVLDSYDVICSPTMPVVAPPVPDGWGSPYADEHMGTWYTAVTNLLRGTAVTYPCGLVDGLPVGLHVMAGPGAETTVLRFARALERLAPWTDRPPC